MVDIWVGVVSGSMRVYAETQILGLLNPIVLELASGRLDVSGWGHGTPSPFDRICSKRYSPSSPATYILSS